MTKQEILNNAKYIQFPYINKTYKEYDVPNIYKLPCITEYDPLYSCSSTDKHHYTTKYHREYVLPTMEKLLNFGYSESDFYLISCENNNCDLSYMVPKNKMKFDVHWLLGTKTYLNIDFENGLIFNENEKNGDKFYRNMIIGCHTSLRIINKTTSSNRILLISGDSQIIPDIGILACYFKETWYLDNRSGKIDNETMDINKTISIQNKYKNIVFTDILISLYANPLEWYTTINLK